MSFVSFVRYRGRRTSKRTCRFFCSCLFSMEERRSFRLQGAVRFPPPFLFTSAVAPNDRVHEKTRPLSLESPVHRFLSSFGACLLLTRKEPPYLPKNPPLISPGQTPYFWPPLAALETIAVCLPFALRGFVMDYRFIRQVSVRPRSRLAWSETSITICFPAHLPAQFSEGLFSILRIVRCDIRVLPPTVPSL